MPGNTFLFCSCVMGRSRTSDKRHCKACGQPARGHDGPMGVNKCKNFIGAEERAPIFNNLGGELSDSDSDCDLANFVIDDMGEAESHMNYRDILDADNSHARGGSSPQWHSVGRRGGRPGRGASAPSRPSAYPSVQFSGATASAELEEDVSTPPRFRVQPTGLDEDGEGACGGATSFVSVPGQTFLHQAPVRFQGPTRRHGQPAGQPLNFGGRGMQPPFQPSFPSAARGFQPRPFSAAPLPRPILRAEQSSHQGYRPGSLNNVIIDPPGPSDRRSDRNMDSNHVNFHFNDNVNLPFDRNIDFTRVNNVNLQHADNFVYSHFSEQGPFHPYGEPGAESLPAPRGTEHVRQRSRQAAIGGEYVDLTELLVSHASYDIDELRTVIDSSGCVSFRASRPRRVIGSSYRWLEAWTVLELIMAHVHGVEMFAEMARYRLFMLSLFSKYRLAYCLNFDIRHRQVLGANRSLNFSTIDYQLFIMMFDSLSLRAVTKCGRCSSTDHPTQECPMPFRAPGQGGDLPRGRRSGERQQGQGSQTDRSGEVCYLFQEGRCKAGAKCVRKHVCLNCGGSEPFKTCSKCKKSQKGGSGAGASS